MRGCSGKVILRSGGIFFSPSALDNFSLDQFKDNTGGIVGNNGVQKSDRSDIGCGAVIGDGWT